MNKYYTQNIIYKKRSVEIQSKKLFNKIFCCYKENSNLIIKILGIKCTFKWLGINQLEDCCCIPNLNYFKERATFPHPIGITINAKTKIGFNCTIFQNVTIGDDGNNIENVPEIGENVIIYANAVIIGKIKIGNNAIIGAGSVVCKDVPDNAVVVGKPARVIRYRF